MASHRFTCLKIMKFTECKNIRNQCNFYKKFILLKENIDNCGWIKPAESIQAAYHQQNLSAPERATPLMSS